MTSSFFKILLDPSACNMPLPNDFVSKHLKNKIPNAAIIRSANGGYSWELKIKQVEDDYCFCDGWNNVAKDIQLSFWDFLLFSLVDDQSTFKLSIYGPDGCERNLPQKIDHGGGEGGDVDEDVAVEFENVADEDNENYEKNEDPFFVSIISQTPKFLRFPKGFAELVGIDSEGSMTIKNLDGKEWVTGLKFDKSFRITKRYLLSRGWQSFRRENNLSEGDECVFKFIRSEGKLLLEKVTKTKCPAPSDEFLVRKVAKRGRRQPDHEHGGNVDAGNAT